MEQSCLSPHDGSRCDAPAVDGRPHADAAGARWCVGDVWDTAVVAVEGPLLATGTPVTIIGLKHPQQVVQATIARRLDRSDLMAKHSLSGPFYEVRTEAASPRPDLGVVIVGRATARTSQDSVSVRIDGGGAELRVRSCTSSEGLHLTVWLGIPLQSARLWHQVPLSRLRHRTHLHAG